MIQKGTSDEYRAMLVLKEAELIAAKAELTGNRHYDWRITSAILCLEADITDLRRWLGRTATETKDVRNRGGSGGMKAGNVVNYAVSVPATRHATPAKSGQLLLVRPLAFTVARTLIERYHYLHSMPGGTKLSFGVFVGAELLGVITLGAGPQNAFSLVHQTKPEDCLCLTRLWLSDSLPKNSESKVIGIVLRALRRYTEVKFVVSYADPSQGHLGTVYQATNFLYIGLSQPMPLYDLGDGKGRHSRSPAHGFGTHSVKHLVANGVVVQLIEQSCKHRYIYFLDASWRPRLKPQVLPYPKNGPGEDRSGGVVWGG